MAPLKTTVIGSMAKPDYLKIPCWVGSDGILTSDYFDRYRDAKKQYTCQQLDEQLMRATKEAIDCQRSLGIDIGTDGEMARVNYIFHFCRRLNGFNFENDVEVTIRNGAWVGRLPRIVDTITSKPTKDHLHVAEDWARAQSLSPEFDLKFTLPGPITIFDTMKNEFYKDKKSFAMDIAKYINEAVLSLAQRGCKYIQVRIIKEIIKKN